MLHREKQLIQRVYSAGIEQQQVEQVPADSGPSTNLAKPGELCDVPNPNHTALRMLDKIATIK
jgi:hypothetical protein